MSPRDRFRLVRRAGQLDAAGLAPAADEDLGLDDDPVGAGRQEPLGGRARLGRRPGDLPRRDGQALGEEQRLGVGFLDLHAGGLRIRRGRGGWGEGQGRRWYRAVRSPTGPDGTKSRATAPPGCGSRRPHRVAAAGRARVPLG